jgi:16S rRNA (cytosine967-C5)-methyltransferase
MNKEKKTPKKIQARKIAFLVLKSVETDDAFADILLDNYFENYIINSRDKALASELTYGVLRFKLLLDYYIGQVSSRKIEDLKLKVLIPLRIGAYQILKLDRIPESAAVNESVKLSPEFARGFVNAVLRNLIRKKNELKSPDTIVDPIERLAVSESHPKWMVKRLVDSMGIEEAKLLLAANNKRAPLTLRVNTLRTGRDAYIRMLEANDIKSSAGKYSDTAVVLEKYLSVKGLPGYTDGLFAVQDEASQLVAKVLSPTPGWKIMDACAAPGTKSLAIMEQMNGRGKVMAVDIHERRLSRMVSESKRLGIKNVTRVVADACVNIDRPKKFKDVMFDAILVDAPCTGLGTIRRHPEIKWRRQEEDIIERATLQKNILANVSAMLRPGGVLVYSTCTFTKEENEEVVSKILSADEFKMEDPKDFLSSSAKLVKDRVVSTWTHKTGMDTFTIIRLKKNKR